MDLRTCVTHTLRVSIIFLDRNFLSRWISAMFLFWDTKDTLTTLHNLAGLLIGVDPFRAEPMVQRCLDCCRGALGESHPTTLSAENQLALCQVEMGHYQKAGLQVSSWKPFCHKTVLFAREGVRKAKKTRSVSQGGGFQPGMLGSSRACVGCKPSRHIDLSEQSGKLLQRHGRPPASGVALAASCVAAEYRGRRGGFGGCTFGNLAWTSWIDFLCVCSFCEHVRWSSVRSVKRLHKLLHSAARVAQLRGC